VHAGADGIGIVRPRYQDEEFAQMTQQKCGAMAIVIVPSGMELCAVVELSRSKMNERRGKWLVQEEEGW
jgi:hypothetical protein